MNYSCTPWIMETAAQHVYTGVRACSVDALAGSASARAVCKRSARVYIMASY